MTRSDVEHRSGPCRPPELRSPECDRAARFRAMTVGLFYMGLFFTALFLEVYVRMQVKSRSLEIWTLTRRKAEIESELTRLDMRLTVLESPMRLESLASSEIGLTAAIPQQQTPAKK